MGIRAAKKSTKRRGAKTTAAGQPGNIDVGDRVNVLCYDYYRNKDDSGVRLIAGVLKSWNYQGCLLVIVDIMNQYLVHWS